MFAGGDAAAGVALTLALVPAPGGGFSGSGTLAGLSGGPRPVVVVAAAPDARRDGTMAVAVVPAASAEAAADGAAGGGGGGVGAEAAPLLGGRLSWGAGGGGGDALEGTLTSLVDGSTAVFAVRWVEARAAEAAHAAATAVPLVAARAAAQEALARAQSECAVAERAAAAAEATALAARVRATAAKARRVAAACGMPDPEAAALASGLAAALRAADDDGAGPGGGGLAAAALHELSAFALAEAAYEHALGRVRAAVESGECSDDGGDGDVTAAVAARAGVRAAFLAAAAKHGAAAAEHAQGTALDHAAALERHLGPLRQWAPARAPNEAAVRSVAAMGFSEDEARAALALAARRGGGTVRPRVTPFYFPKLKGTQRSLRRQNCA